MIRRSCKSALLIAIGCLLVMALGGCAAREMQPEQWKNTELSRFWPEPPAQKRIELLRAVGSPEDLGAGDGSFLDWLLGGSDEVFPLVSPYGITADGRGRVWVADPGGGRVQLFDLAEEDVRYIDRVGSYALVSPVDIAYTAASGRLYVSDSGLGRVFVISASGDLLNSLAPPTGFGRPAGIAVADNGDVYVVDVVAGRVEVFDDEGSHLRSVVSLAAENGRFLGPSNVHVDSQGRIYVVDSLRFRVEIQSADGSLLNLIGEAGDTPGRFARPRGISVDSFGHIYVADAAFDNIQIFDLTGNLLLHFGFPGGKPGEFCLPAGLHIDQDDRIYVAESCNYRFQIFRFLADGL